jgi:hypothetical protein
VEKRCALAIAIGVGFACAYFYEAGGWNQNSRFDMARAVVEKHTLSIDAYLGNTGDRARFGGHFYSDKAPGLALAAVPVVAAARFVAPRSPGFWTYAATVGVVGLPLALAAVALFFAARRLGSGIGGAAFGALVWGVGTPALSYGTLFWGHALAAACLVFAYLAALKLADSTTKRDWLLAAGVGVSAGWAVVTEFPAAPAAVLLAAFALWQRRTWRVGAGVTAGAIAAASVLLLYQKVAFGSATHVGYSSVEGFSGMKEGFLGITYPKGHVLVAILFGTFRGLLPLAPACALGPAGLWLLGREQSKRAAALTAGGVALYYVLFNSAYHYWNGGWSYGPRHLSPALPFLCLGLAILWTRARTPLRAGMGALAAWGFALALMCVATTSQPSDLERHPVGHLIWPAFWSGDLSLNPESFFDPHADWRKLRNQPRATHAAWNLGEKLGLHGLPSLLPLLLVWGTCGYVIVRSAYPPRSRSNSA